MGIKNVIMLLSVFGLSIIFSNCTQNQIDSDKLCVEFFKLNKGKNFEGLYDIAIGGRRITSVYDESTNQYEYVFNIIDVYDYKSDEFLMLPIFKRDATLSEKDSTFKEVGQEAKNYLSEKYNIDSESEIFSSFIEYVKMIYAQYDSIETPEGFGFKNVLIEGHPRSGKLITFILNDKCKVYYLGDDSSLTEYWEGYLKTLNKLDEKWYYEATAK